jgi:(5-formylfuran-3-yl)methyl phosphate synthase
LASLLVSVRSPFEARAAVAGGASIIDVKEPSRGSLGRCDASVWQAVRSAVPRSIPVSVALGELNEWSVSGHPRISASAWAGIAFCKLGLADAPADWKKRWRRLRDELRRQVTPFPNWVAVVYLDWEAARAPHPEAIIEAVTEIPECRAVLFDTWSKSSGARLDCTWKRQVERVRDCGRLVALAGSIDAVAIERWRGWHSDVFAVRGAACAGGNRLGPIDTARVARLAAAARGRPELAALAGPAGSDVEAHTLSER